MYKQAVHPATEVLQKIRKIHFGHIWKPKKTREQTKTGRVPPPIFQFSIKLKLATATIFLFCSLFLTGCMTLFNSNANQYDGPYVRLIIKPDIKKICASSIGIFSFEYLQTNNVLGDSFAQYVHDYCLEHQFTRLVALMNLGTAGRTIKDSIAIGKKTGYDLILVGSINKFFDGGLSCHSKVSISFKIIDSHTNTTLWYVKGYMEGRHEKVYDYLFFLKKARKHPLHDYSA